MAYRPFTLAAAVMGLLAATGCPSSPGAGAADAGPLGRSIGGSVSGLLGKGLVLQDNGGDDLAIASDGPFAFAAKLDDGAAFAVSVKAQPAAPAQTCTVGFGSGVATGSDVTGVKVTCAKDTYEVKVAVSGLADGFGVVLQNNGGDDLMVAANGTFAFPTRLADGSGFQVSVKAQPFGQTCTASQGSGTLAGASPATASVVCSSVTYSVGGTIAGLAAGKVVLENNGADAIAVSGDHFAFTAKVANGAGYAVTVKARPPGQTCTVAQASGTVWYRDVTSVAITCAEARYVTDGTVNALATAADGTIYLGGSFSRVGRATGSGVLVGASTGQAQAKFPRFAGLIRVAIPDGTGGFYVGGEFSGVDGQARANLAHVKPDGSLDQAFSPNPDGAVLALALGGNGVLYVGGTFTQIGGQARNRLAALDATGAATGWNPGADAPVAAMAFEADVLYIGGAFKQVGGQTRSNLAAIDLTGALTGWAPACTGMVSALAVDGGTVFVGGTFNSVNGSTRFRLAAINAGTGSVSNWNPGVNSQVNALAVTPTRVYVGGSFWGYSQPSLPGQFYQQFGLVALERTVGNKVASWIPDPKLSMPGANPEVTSLSVSNGTVYVGGLFDTIGGAARSGLAALDENTGRASDWDPHPWGSVKTIVRAGSEVFIGGQFAGLGGLARKNLAAIDPATGAPTAWDPGADNQVNALAVAGGTVYAGGDFIHAGGAARNHLAALDASGAATSWNPDVQSPVNALVAAGGLVYVGGSFVQVGATRRTGLAAIDSTGAATAFNPSADDAVLAMALNGSTLYVSGWFANIDGKARSGLAALDLTGAALPWNPAPDDVVSGYAFSGTTVYVGGGFRNIGGKARTGVAALDASGQATAWDAAADDVATAIALAGDTLYVAGSFGQIGGQRRSGLAAFDVKTGDLTAWNPSASSGVSTLLVQGENLLLGGSFTTFGNEPWASYAELAR